MAAGAAVCSLAALRRVADDAWTGCDRADILEAFAAIRRSGRIWTPADRAVHSAPVHGHAEWSAQEQSGADAAADDVRQRLAAGKSRIRGAVRLHFHHLRHRQIGRRDADGRWTRASVTRPDEELPIAAEEQRQITQLRLAKLVSDAATIMITTHVLDIARGGPAVGVTVILELRQASEWTPIGRGVTDGEGRVDDADGGADRRPAPIG